MLARGQRRGGSEGPDALTIGQCGSEKFGTVIDCHRGSGHRRARYLRLQVGRGALQGVDHRCRNHRITGHIGQNARIENRSHLGIIISPFIIDEVDLHFVVLGIPIGIQEFGPRIEHVAVGITTQGTERIRQRCLEELIPSSIRSRFHERIHPASRGQEEPHNVLPSSKFGTHRQFEGRLLHGRYRTFHLNGGFQRKPEQTHIGPQFIDF